MLAAVAFSPPCSVWQPFQKVEFLVRDWQNFDNDDPSSSSDFEDLEREMDSYVKGVIADRDAKDLAETRQQIAMCFEKVDCYLLTHPGFEVTKKKYDGDPKGELLSWSGRLINWTHPKLVTSPFPYPPAVLAMARFGSRRPDLHGAPR